MEDDAEITARSARGRSPEATPSIVNVAAALVEEIVDEGEETAAREREMDAKKHSNKEKRKRKRGRVRRNRNERPQSYGCEKSVDIRDGTSADGVGGEISAVNKERGIEINGVIETRSKLDANTPEINKVCSNVDTVCDGGTLDRESGENSVTPEELNEKTIGKNMKGKSGKTGPDPGRRKNSVPKQKFTQRSWLDDDAGDASETDALKMTSFVASAESSIRTRDLDANECTSSAKLVPSSNTGENDGQSSTKSRDAVVFNENVETSDDFDVRMNEKCQNLSSGKCIPEDDAGEERKASVKVDESLFNDDRNKRKTVLSDKDNIKKELLEKNLNFKATGRNVNCLSFMRSGDERNRPADGPVSKSLPSAMRDHTSIQLNAYKNRFTGCGDVRNYEQSNMNNATCSKRDVDVRIGTNVNDLRGDRTDKVKRSRRKTEPFDFELQSDGVPPENNKPRRESPELFSDTPSFVNAHDEKPYFVDDNKIASVGGADYEKSNNSYANSFSGADKTRNLFSGFISDAGVFVPTSNMDKRSSRDSLDRIFDEECSDDDSPYDYDVDFEDGDGTESGNGSSDCRSESEDEALPPEPQLGNVEYKLKLVTPTKQRFEHLVTQMKWRLREGRGEALYEIGVRDCGRVRGLSGRDLRASLRTLRRMAARLGAACALLTRGRVPGNPKRERAEVLVRKIPDDQHNIEVRVAVMGSNDAGKSTLVGVLTQGELDNGRGRARLNMFRHLHEVRTGRTSSVSHEILGFDPQGHPINYAYSELMTSEEIAERSSKLVSFIDLAGHRKYLKTTVQGLTGYSPHYAMLVVSATAGINQMTLEHLALVTALDLPFFIAVTKIDSATPDKVIESLRQALNTIGCRKVPLPVLTQDDVILAASNALSRVAVPVFPVSSVSGCGLDRLGWFLFLAPPAMATCERDRLEQEPVEFQIDETFKVGGTSGPVVGGLLTKGVLTERTRLLIGPLDSGDFVPTTVVSLHRNKAPCRVVRAGQAASLGLSVRPPTLRQGMVILAIPDGHRGQPKPGTQNDVNQNVRNETDPQMRRRNVMAVEGKECNLKVRQEDIAEICNGIGVKGITDGVNVTKRVDDDEKLTRLSPSRYANRFISSFGNTPATPSASVDIDIDSIEGSDDDSNGNDTKSHDEDEKMAADEGKEPDSYPRDMDEGILKEDPNNPRGCYCFQATVSVLYHSTAIYPGFQATVHIGNIRQTAVIEGILAANSVLRAKDRAPVVFRFVRHPEYVKTGARLLFREGLRTKGVGVVTQVFPHASSHRIQHDK